MKILLATGIFAPDIGGPATYSALLQKELPKRGIDIKIITYGPAGVSRSIPKGIRHLYYFFLCIYHGRKADVIFSQDPVSAGFPAFLAAKLLRKKFLMRAAGDHAWEQSVQRFGVTENIDDFQTQKYGFRVRSLRFIQNFVATGADAIITPSKYFKTVVAHWVKGSSDKIEVIYNGIDLPPKTVISENDQLAKKIVSVGRLVPWKGFDRLIDLIQKMPEWSLEIVGDGPEHDALQRKVRRLGLEHRITLTPSVSRMELLDILRNSGVFVLNTYFESFSFALVEAMSVGMPIITTNIGNLSEIVEHGKDAFLIEPGDLKAMQGSIQVFEQDSRKRFLMRQSAQERAQVFSIKNTLDQVTKLLENLSQKKN